MPADRERRRGDPRPEPPPAVRWIARTLEEAGHETWAVGGAVRDALLGTPSGDWDLTTRARPGTIRRLFRRTVPLGMDHGTVGVLSRDGTLYEVTTFRRDVETTGRHAVVEFADRVEDDLARRDFTINALAWHPLREELLDPFHGVRDLEQGVLRTVGEPAERFREDYLRVLRALRFAGTFSLRIDPDTWEALCRVASRIRRLSAERVREELMKVLGGGSPPSRPLALYAASGCLAVAVPELRRTVGFTRGGDGPVAGGAAPGGDGPDDLWSHGLRVADLLPAHRPFLRLAALLRGAALPDAGTTRTEDAAPAGTPVPHRGALRAAAVMERLRYSNAQIREVGEVVEASLFSLPDPADPVSVRRWLHGVGRDRFRSVLRIHLAAGRADAVRTGEAVDGVLELRRRALEELRAGSALGVEELAIGGRDLIRVGLRPGPHFKEILDHLLEGVLDDPSRNDPETLREAALAYARERGFLDEEGR